ncbi:MAG TPA: hypothetical protein VIL09_17645 [Microvirga sp.]|jgi:predicted DNA-binding transcriptional regulator AlpA
MSNLKLKSGVRIPPVPDDLVLTNLPDLARHKVLNTAEAAAYLNFSVPHFRRLYRSGGVPAPIQLSQRKLGWKLGDLIDWVAARECRPLTGTAAEVRHG